MKKKMISALLAFLLVLGMAPAVGATDGKVITFKGEAEKFVEEVSGDPQGFSNMEPGEERHVDLTLVNADSNEMKFFMSAEILDNIAAKTKDMQGVYDFSIAKDGQVFFATVIGGGTANNVSVGDEYLDQSNRILLDTLAKDQSSVITITLKLDGDSAGNTYMNQTGEIEFVFSVETPETQSTTVIEKVVQYIRTAGKTAEASPNTGIQGSHAAAAAVVLVLAVIGLIVLTKYQKRREDK